MMKLAIIGAGNMAEAIARGVVGGGRFSADSIVASDIAADRRNLFQDDLGIRAVERNEEAARDASIVLLSVKPQQMAGALATLAPALNRDVLVVSIAAGLSTATIASHLGSGANWRIVRAIPNTPMLVGEGVVALSPGAHAMREDLNVARSLFENSAIVIDVPEDKLDAVTAVSGSGPAYFFYFVEHLIRAGEANGLTHAEAKLLATRTAIGAGKMLATANDSVQELRRKVTSPGGTTAAAIESFDRAGLDRTIIEAVTQAAERGRELGRK